MFHNKIIDTKEEFEYYISPLFNFILVPIYKDNRIHPCNQSISALVVIDTLDWYRYIIPIEHSEKIGDIDIDYFNESIEDKSVFVWDKKSFLNHTYKKDLIDFQLMVYYNGDHVEEPSFFSHYYSKWNRFKNINTIIPIVKIFDEVGKWIDDNDIINIFNRNKFIILNKNYQKYEDVIHTFNLIEKNGILHKNNGVEYTQYNMFTTTGRPSNRFGGINYAGLNKSDDTRSNYINKHQGGTFYLYDYQAFHPTIISNYLKIERPTQKSIHYWLGQQYFNKQELTDEEYEESKRLTFYYLYGNISEVEHIDFFKKTSDFIKTFKGLDEITSPIFKRKIITKGLNEHKIFNYFLQCLESEINFIKLKKLNDYLLDKKSKMILYTYDSFLIDYHPDDSESIVLDIKKILEEHQFSVTIKSGNDYKNMNEVK